MSNKNIQATDSTTAAGVPSADATPQTAAPLPAFYLEMLAGQARQALYDWLKARAPAYVLTVFDGAECLDLFAAHPNDATIARPHEVAAIVLDVLKGMRAMGAALDEVQS